MATHKAAPPAPAAPARSARPWDRRPGESARAYSLFVQWLTATPQPDLAALAPNARNNSSQHEWAERRRAYEAHDLEQRRDARELVRDAARQRLVDETAALIGHLIDLGEGRMPPGDVTPIQDRHGNEIGKRAVVPPGVRFAALCRALDMAGMTVPKRVELTGVDGEEIKIRARDALGDLSGEELAKLARALGVPR